VVHPAFTLEFKLWLALFYPGARVVPARSGSANKVGLEFFTPAPLSTRCDRGPVARRSRCRCQATPRNCGQPAGAPE